MKYSFDAYIPDSCGLIRAYRVTIIKTKKKTVLESVRIMELGMTMKLDLDILSDSFKKILKTECLKTYLKVNK